MYDYPPTHPSTQSPTYPPSSHTHAPLDDGVLEEDVAKGEEDVEDSVTDLHAGGQNYGHVLQTHLVQLLLRMSQSMVICVCDEWVEYVWNTWDTNE